jgi:hypothetical protein
MRLFFPPLQGERKTKRARTRALISFFQNEPAMPDTIAGQGRYTPGLWAWLVRAGHVPAYPGADVVLLVQTPPPPLLRETHTDEVCGELLARAYRVAHKVVLGKPCNVLRKRGSVMGYRHLSKLCHAAASFIVHEIAPLQWAVWRFEWWRDKVENKRYGRPTLTWVYDADEISKRRGWFRAEFGERATHSALTPQHRALVQRWVRMRAALAELPSLQDLGAVQAAVARYFPDGAYETAIEAARLEADTHQRNIDRRVRRGEWLW